MKSQKANDANRPPDTVFVEWLKRPSIQGDEFAYRFLVSGCVFNGALSGDPFRSTLGGLILEQPFSIWKVGISFDDYPQEIAACFKASESVLSRGRGLNQTSCHRIIAEDIASVLTLYFRRLVVCVGLVDQHLGSHYSQLPFPPRYPHAIVDAARTAYHWPAQPITRISGADSVDYVCNNPPRVAVNPDELGVFLHKISNHMHSKEIMHAIRMYRKAMECYFQAPETCYLLLVCATESVAQTRKYTEAERLEQHNIKTLMKRLKKLQVSEIDAKRLALETFDRTPITDAFCKFLMQYGNNHSGKPVIFYPEVLNLYSVEDEHASLKMAYIERCNFVHSSKPFYSSSLAGTSRSMPWNELEEHMDRVLNQNKTLKPWAPPMNWLERIVSTALQSFIQG